MDVLCLKENLAFGKVSSVYTVDKDEDQGIGERENLFDWMSRLEGKLCIFTSLLQSLL